MLTGKRVAVVGLAKSGVAAVNFLTAKGATVVATDIKPAVQLPDIASRLPEGVQLVLGMHPIELLNDIDLIVLSPGVPNNIPFLEKARQDNKIPIWSELELAARFCNAPILAVTGANGKTTTTAWLGEMLRASGKKVIVAGNIGVPMSEVVDQATPEHLVIAEVSSFQLEATESFSPWIACLLNLTADHLDRHGSFAAYMMAKAQIFRNQRADDYSIFNADDENLHALSEHVQGQVFKFSRKRELNAGAFVKNGRLLIRNRGKEWELCSEKEISLPGTHNLENSLAAALMAYLGGASLAAIVKLLKTFSGIEHRCEFVAEISGVRFINDSKGTNPDAAIKALNAFKAPIILIAGGRSKGTDFTELAQVAGKRTKAVILLGEAAPVLRRSLAQNGNEVIFEVSTLEEAVDKAYAIASTGDYVLLSPACASWDMFNNYEERGRVFKEAVTELGRRLG